MELITKLMKTNDCFLSIDIGGSFIKYGHISSEFKIIKRSIKPTKLFDSIEDFINYLLENLSNEYAAICISAPGIIENHRYIVSNPGGALNILFKSNFIEMIEHKTHCDVFLINDGMAAAYCEHHVGCVKNIDSFVMLLIGTGLGGAVFLNNKPFRGTDNVVGEFSGIPLCYSNDGSMYRLGSICSINFLINNYNSIASTNYEEAKPIIELSQKGDSIAIHQIELWVKNIILAISIVGLCYNPKAICLGGGVTQNNWFINKLKTMYNNASTPFKGRIKTELLISDYRNDANLIGSVVAYLRGD